MVTLVAKVRSGKTGEFVTVKAGAKATRLSTVRFGAVTIKAKKPTAAEVKKNVDLSTSALDRVTKRIARPGVKLRPKKGVPLFFSDPENPDFLLRRLNGRIERGVLENGVFKVTE